jgi:hypothetical protein
MFKSIVALMLFVTSIAAFAQDSIAAEWEWLVSLAQTYPWLMLGLSALGSLVVISQVVVPLTPTKADDAFLEKAKQSFWWKIVDAITFFAPIKKK